MKRITHTGEVTSASGGFKVGAFTSSVYLGDVGRRNGLGGGGSIYQLGQDQYLASGDSVDLVATGDVLLSIEKGVIAKLVEVGLLEVEDV
jgi:hypothetical protein